MRAAVLILALGLAGCNASTSAKLDKLSGAVEQVNDQTIRSTCETYANIDALYQARLAGSSIKSKLWGITPVQEAGARAALDKFCPLYLNAFNPGLIAITNDVIQAITAYHLAEAAYIRGG